MTFRSRICSDRRATAALLFLANAVLSAATVTGRVEIVASRDPDVRKHSDYSGVVVWLEPASGSNGFPPQGRKMEMAQKDKRFNPHVLPVTVGTTVMFPNFDPIFHNAFSNYNGQIFDVGLYAPGSTRGILFRKPGIVRVFCNIHPTMSAVIVVLKSPYFAISGKTGAFSIANVPPGSYRLHVFHERATEQTLEALGRVVEVGDGSVELPPIKVSETGFLLVPHKNKYGKDYPPVTETGAYTGARP
jgi:plastocyanin